MFATNAAAVSESDESQISEDSHCEACEAQFGVKFSAYVCGSCRKSFCGGDLIRSENLKVHHSLNAALAGHGLCLACVLAFWGKTDEQIAPVRGIFGRLLFGARAAYERLAQVLPGKVDRSGLIRVEDFAFEQMNSTKAWAVFRHQKDVTLDEMAEDLVLFARVYAVSQGRSTERSIALSDIYELVDWIRSHPVLPGWLHGIQWSTIESSPSYMAFASDVWHVAQAAMALGNPAGLAYHLADRVVDQVGGKGLAAGAYDLVKEKLGINVNVKNALMSYLAGLVIMQILKRRK